MSWLNATFAVLFVVLTLLIVLFSKGFILAFPLLALAWRASDQSFEARRAEAIRIAEQAEATAIQVSQLPPVVGEDDPRQVEPLFSAELPYALTYLELGTKLLEKCEQALINEKIAPGSAEWLTRLSDGQLMYKCLRYMQFVSSATFSKTMKCARVDVTVRQSWRDWLEVCTAHIAFCRREADAAQEQGARPAGAPPDAETSPGAPELDAFEILQVPRTASTEDIRQSYVRLVKEYHPDRVSHLGAKLKGVAEEEFKRIQWAYDRLGRPGT